MLQGLRRLLFALALALATTVPANAVVETFSFRWDIDPTHPDDKTAITGTFQGDVNGNYITNLTNISLFRGGAAFVGNTQMFTAQMDYDTQDWVAGGYLSVDGTDNNVLFIDTDYVNGDAGFINFVYFVSGVGSMAFEPSFRQRMGAESVAALGIESLDPVPEPDSWALMVIGFACVGAGIRMRRKPRQA